MKKMISLGVLMLTMFAPSLVFAQWSAGRSYAQSAGLPQGSILGIALSTMNWLLAILGLLGIIAFVIAGIMYLTAAGDEGQIDTAKTAAKYSVIGVIVALLGYVVIQAAEAWLRGSSSF